MDIENLNRTQIVLLTLLVSFVTSIATGIVTVTLMDQAPPAITQTIHRVVEKTIETVTPEKQQATVSEKIVVVKEQSYIADAIEKNVDSILRIGVKSPGGKNLFAGIGIVVDKSGILATSKEIISKDSAYYIEGEKEINLEIIGSSSDKKLIYLKADVATSTKSVFKVATLSDNNLLKLGQSVITIGGQESTEISTGIISGFVKEVSEPINSSEERGGVSVIGIKTNILTSNIVSGSPLINLEGKIIGINFDSKNNSFFLVNTIKEDLQNILKPVKIN